jgi:hypothetical protein
VANPTIEPTTASVPLAVLVDIFAEIQSRRNVQ